jgi:hypothetical protein
MKNIVIITLDLTGPAGSYEELFDKIKSEGQWWHYMKSTWLIHTDKTPEEIVDELKPHLKGQGRMLVAILNKPYQGILPKAAWAWIRNKIVAE